MKTLAQYQGIKLELVTKLAEYKNYSTNNVFKKKFITKKIEELRAEIRKVSYNIWRTKNKDRINARTRELRKLNPLKYRETRNKWRENNVERRLYEREYHKNLRNTSLQKYWEYRIRTITREHYRGVKDTNKTLRSRLMGCTPTEFREYVKSKWESWMDDTNYGRVYGDNSQTWNFHHVVSLSSFDLTKLKERKKAAHYTNVMPINGITNTQLGRCK